MRHRLRLYVLYLLLFSLPVQGIAGVARIACGMAHDSPVVSNISQVDVSIAVLVASNVPERGHYHAGAVAPTDSQSEDCDDAGSRHRTSCGTCSGCSIGAYAPPPALAVTAANEAANGAEELSPSSFSGHIPSRIERPPRIA